MGRPNSDDVVLSLLDRFDCRLGGRRVVVAPRGQRLLALLALEGGTASRRWLADTLWPDHPPRRRQPNLRGVLFRLPPALRAHLVVGEHVALGDAVTVDLVDASRLAREAGVEEVIHLDADTSPLQLTLLPDWDESWLETHRQRWEDLRLRALEAIAAHHRAGGRTREALATVETAVAASPLRETSVRLLVQLHLDEGNLADAHAAADRFTLALHDAYGIEPTPEFQRLLAVPDRRDAAATPD